MSVVWPDLLQIVLVSLRVSGSALFISALIGIPLGAWLGLSRFRFRQLLVILIYTGMGFPPVVVGLAVYLALSQSGPFGSLAWLFTEQAMIAAQVIIAFPLVAGLTMAAVESLDSDLRLQVCSLGADPRQEIFTLLSEAREGVLASIVAGFGGIISEVGAAMLVGGNIAGSTRVMSTAIVLETRQGNFGLGLALGGVLLVIVFVLNGILLQLQYPLWRRR
ncbi:MAG: ABC transporter permease [Anaerolineales bacterium]|nr:ABC transporter permease [Anaerolineales bacterium]